MEDSNHSWERPETPGFDGEKLDLLVPLAVETDPEAVKHPSPLSEPPR